MTEDEEKKILDELGLDSPGLGKACATYSGLEINEDDVKNLKVEKENKVKTSP